MTKCNLAHSLACWTRAQWFRYNPGRVRIVSTFEVLNVLKIVIVIVVIIIIIIIIIIITFSIRVNLWGRTCYLSTDFVYVQFVGHTAKDSHSRHVLNCCITIFYTDVGMFMICFHTKFQKSSSIGSLIIAIKLKTKKRFCAAAIFCCTFYKNNYLPKV
jgi:hypothetical protein